MLSEATHYSLVRPADIAYWENFTTSKNNLSRIRRNYIKSPRVEIADWLSCKVESDSQELLKKIQVQCNLKLIPGTPELTFKVTSTKDQSSLVAFQIPDSDFALISFNPGSNIGLINLQTICAKTDDWVNQFIMRGFKGFLKSGITIANDSNQSSACFEAVNGQQMVEISMPDGSIRDIAVNLENNQGVFRVVHIGDEMKVVLGDPSDPNNLVGLEQFKIALESQTNIANGNKKADVPIYKIDIRLPDSVNNIPLPTPTATFVPPATLIPLTTTMPPHLQSGELLYPFIDKIQPRIVPNYMTTTIFLNKNATAYLQTGENNQMWQVLVENAGNPLSDPSKIGDAMRDIRKSSEKTLVEQLFDINKMNSPAMILKEDGSMVAFSKVIKISSSPGSNDLIIVGITPDGRYGVVITKLSNIENNKLKVTLSDVNGNIDEIGTQGTYNILLEQAKRQFSLGTSIAEATEVFIFPGDMIPRSILDTQVGFLARQISNDGKKTVMGFLPDGTIVNIPVGVRGSFDGLVCPPNEVCWATLQVNTRDLSNIPDDVKIPFTEEVAKYYKSGLTPPPFFTVYVKLFDVLKPDLPGNLQPQRPTPTPSPQGAIQNDVINNYMLFTATALADMPSGSVSINLPTQKQQDDLILARLKNNDKRKF